MKKTLVSNEYILLSQAFKEWLALLNYSPLSIPYLTGSIRDFLYYQEQRGKSSILQLEASDANQFLHYLGQQTGERTGRPFTAGHINKHIQALKLFSLYVRQTGRSAVGFVLDWLTETRGKPGWLTKAEIGALYEATGDSVLGMRDRAMLSVLYGCGLRLNEAASLELRDIGADTRLLHVRKGKGSRERYVPIAGRNYSDLRVYVDVGRPQLMGDNRHAYIFVNVGKGRPIHKQSLYLRVRRLLKIAKITKKVSTHSLRHSIATHLLASGMKLERVQQFLGHRHLDSTQIYTHLANESL